MGDWKRAANEAFYRSYGHVATNERTGPYLADYMTEKTGVSHTGKTTRSGSYATSATGDHYSYHTLGADSRSGAIHGKTACGKHVCRLSPYMDPKTGTLSGFNMRDVGSERADNTLMHFTGVFGEAIGHAVKGHPGSAYTRNVRTLRARNNGRTGGSGIGSGFGVSGKRRRATRRLRRKSATKEV